MYSFTQTWRWGAWIVVALGGVDVILLYIYFRPQPRASSIQFTWQQNLRRIDYVGGFMKISGITLFMVGLQMGGYL